MVAIVSVGGWGGGVTRDILVAAARRARIRDRHRGFLVHRARLI